MPVLDLTDDEYAVLQIIADQYGVEYADPNNPVEAHLLARLCTPLVAIQPVRYYGDTFTADQEANAWDIWPHRNLLFGEYFGYPVRIHIDPASQAVSYGCTFMDGVQFVYD